ncbi:MAG: chain-length determining protein [Thalassovita sp.]
MAYLFASGRTSVYEASAVIQIEASQVTTNLQGTSTVPTSNRNRLKLIEQKLMSRDSVLTVIEKFDLFAAVSEFSDLEKVNLLRESVQIIEIQDPATVWRADSQPSGLRITARLGNPESAANVANEFLSLALVEGKNRSESRAAQTLAFFTAEEARVSEEISAMEQEFARFKERNAASLPQIITDQREQLTRLQQSQLEIETQFIQLSTNNARVRAEERARQSELLTQQLALVESRIADVERALAAAPEVERIHNVMERQTTQLQEEYRLITARRNEAAMTQQLESQDQFERFEVLETALVPTDAVSSGKLKIVMAGLVASIMGAFGLALMLEMISPVMRTSHQVEKELDVRPVVIIPVLSKPRRGLFQRFASFASL